MNRETRKEHLLEFLRSIQQPGQSVDELDPDQDLKQIGLLDSLAELELILYLENSYGIRFDDTGFNPNQVRTIGRILDLIESRGPEREPG